MVAAMIVSQEGMKPKRIARRLALMREFLERQAGEKKVVRLRADPCNIAPCPRAAEALARLERVAEILRAG